MQTQTNEEHHPCGPSRLGRLLACPPSLPLSKGEPDDGGAVAEEGILLHQSICDVLLGDSRYYAGLNEEQREAVDRCHDFADEVSPDGERFMERRVELRDSRGVINYGTVDFVSVNSDKIVLIDWKFGRKIKESFLVLQVSNYAAAAVQSIPELRSASHLPIEAWVFFPRLRTEPLVWRSVTGKEAPHIVAPRVREIRNTAEASDGTGAKPGDHCEYCPHLPNCDAVRLAGETEIVPAAATDSIVEDDDEMVRKHDLSIVFEKACREYRSRLRKVLLSQPIKGLELRNRAGRRAYTVDADAVRARVVGPDGLSIVEYLDAIEPTVVPLERAYVEKYYDGAGKGKITKGELKKRFAKLMGDAIKQSVSQVLTRV